MRLVVHAALLAIILTTAIVIHIGIAEAQTASLDWSRTERDDVVLWHWQGPERADDLADHAQGAYDLISDLIEAESDQSIVLVVWIPETDPNDTQSLPPELDDEVDPVLVMQNTSGGVRNAVTNQLIDAATGPHAGQVPLWIRLGLGLWAQGPLPGFYLRRAGSVVVLDHEEYYSIEQLETFPQTWQFQAKYLGQAGGTVAWFIQDWGPESLAELFMLVGDGVPFYDAIEQVFGIPEDRLISEFTKNAERSLLLTWPYIESQTPPLYERLNINHIIIIAAALPMLILFFFIGKRLFYD